MISSASAERCKVVAVEHCSSFSGESNKSSAIPISPCMGVRSS